MKTALLAACMVAALLGSTRPCRAEFDVVPYGADGYRYGSYADPAAVPTDWASPAFDDSDLATGAMPFGSWEAGGASCLLAPEANTLWPSPGLLLVRRTFVLPRGTTAVRLHLGVDNNVLVAVNGTLLAADWTLHENCPARDDFFFDVPPRLLNRRGVNVLAVLVHDSGVESWIDVRLTANE